MKPVLVVDDDLDLLDVLAFALRRAGLDVVTAPSAAAAREAMTADPPALIVLDVNLGRASGLDLLREVRATSQAPVILLTALAAEDDKVHGLELGADDYVTKPFSHRELIARIRAHLRRERQDHGPPRAVAARLVAGPLVLDAGSFAALKHGQRLDLTMTEFRLLHYLMLHAGAAVPTRVLLKHVWGYDDAIDTDVVRVTVHRLRRKLEDDPAHPSLLQTVPGVGFLLSAE